MSRNTFIIFVLLGHSRHVYCFDGPAGLRLGFGSYNGTYRLEWPLGARATLRFEPYTHFQRGRDAFPVYFPRRPRKCVEMALGVIDRGIDDAGNCIRVAFAGRKKPGTYLLKLLPKRFGAQRSAANWWNNFGGEAHEVDFFFREWLDHEIVVPLHDRLLSVPSLVDEVFSGIYLPRAESVAIADCLDHIPWSPIAWSIHRGMKDVLVAYALPYLKAYRAPLAVMLHSAVATHAFTLIQQGWEPTFVKGNMADQAASALFGGDQCSGDVCRILSAIVEAVSKKSIEELDHTQFWVQHLQIPAKKEESEMLTGDTVAALIKAHFVWWSSEFDYDIYDKLPLNITVT